MDENICHNNVFSTSKENKRKKFDAEIDRHQGPSSKNWILFFSLLGATLFTTYLAGGFLYALSLFFILAAHEFGHYFAGVKNGVRTSLPLFIPALPSMLPFGTFGAMLLIKDSIPDRRILIEIGAAGPIVGFIVALPILIIGLFLSDVVAPMGGSGLAYGSSIIMLVLSKAILGVTPLSADFNIYWHPLAYAGWVGLFLTTINLSPIGQLDGGHVIYSLYGDKSRIWATSYFVILIFLIYFWPNWGVWAIFFLMFAKFKTPPVIDEKNSLTKGHKRLGYAAIGIFFLTFVPIPWKWVG